MSSSPRPIRRTTIPSPALGRVVEGAEAAQLIGAGLGAAHAQIIGRATDARADDVVAGEPEDVVDAVVLAPVHGFASGIVAVATHEHTDPGPVTADALDHMLEDGADLAPIGRLARAQDHGDRLAAGRLVDVDRQEAALVVVGVEQRQLLMTVHRIERVVDVERDRGRRAIPARPYGRGWR